jgi:hypothetical protein
MIGHGDHGVEKLEPRHDIIGDEACDAPSAVGCVEHLKELRSREGKR